MALASLDALDTLLSTHGREVCDGVLRGVAQMFLGRVRDVDFVARRQGGEFMFLFPETEKAAGAVVVERILEKLRVTEFSEGEKTFRVRASFGLSGLPADTMNAEILRDAAEAALAEAKADGDTVVTYHPDLPRRR